MKALIKEESSVFSVDHDDMGNITSHQMDIHLTDKTSVRKKL